MLIYMIYGIYDATYKYIKYTYVCQVSSREELYMTELLGAWGNTVLESLMVMFWFMLSFKSHEY